MGPAQPWRGLLQSADESELRDGDNAALLTCVGRLHDWVSGAACLRSQEVRLAVFELCRLGTAVVPLGSACGVGACYTGKIDEACRCFWVVTQVALHVWAGVFVGVFVCVSSGALILSLLLCSWHFVDVMCVKSGAMGVLFVGICDCFAYCRLWAVACSARDVDCGYGLCCGVMAPLLSCSLVLRSYLLQIPASRSCHCIK